MTSCPAAGSLRDCLKSDPRRAPENTPALLVVPLRYVRYIVLNVTVS
jgi:hypothetical protein